MLNISSTPGLVPKQKSQMEEKRKSAGPRKPELFAAWRSRLPRLSSTSISLLSILAPASTTSSISPGLEASHRHDVSLHLLPVSPSAQPALFSPPDLQAPSNPGRVPPAPLQSAYTAPSPPPSFTPADCCQGSDQDWLLGGDQHDPNIKLFCISIEMINLSLLKI